MSWKQGPRESIERAQLGGIAKWAYGAGSSKCAIYHQFCSRGEKGEKGGNRIEEAQSGLIVTSREETLQPFKKRYAHEHEPVKDLLGAVKAIRPTALIGSAGVGQSFTKEVIEVMSSINERPIVLALSNLTLQSECTAEQSYTWRHGVRGVPYFGSGSPFDPVKYNNEKLFVPAQVTLEHIEKGLIYPPFSIIRKISANIVVRVAAKAYDLGMATQLPRPKDLVKYAESCMYSPVYRSYSGCIFAPYFDSEQGAAHFAAVHKVFGASNVSKLLLQIPAHKRLDAVVTICYEAQARLRDPVYGCVAHIFALQQQVVNLQAELTYLQAHLATLELPAPPPLPAPPQMPMPGPFSISDLPLSTSVPTTVDLSALFDPPPPQWATAQQPHHHHQQPPQHHQLRQPAPYGAGASVRPGGGPGMAESSGGDELQSLARELLDRHRSGGVKLEHPPPHSR
ncbi:NADP-dependent malic enzyme [Zea mays]|uniref:NADP-dependent malic enzyme n=1 Tax=Zea mays TaxID=4577 RepID=A0A317YHS0_MAIZE|nr:NADP-dependent malic enzyme [Zea mays]